MDSQVGKIENFRQATRVEDGRIKVYYGISRQVDIRIDIINALGRMAVGNALYVEDGGQDGDGTEEGTRTGQGIPSGVTPMPTPNLLSIDIPADTDFQDVFKVRMADRSMARTDKGFKETNILVGNVIVVQAQADNVDDVPANVKILSAVRDKDTIVPNTYET